MFQQKNLKELRMFASCRLINCCRDRSLFSSWTPNDTNTVIDMKANRLLNNSAADDGSCRSLPCIYLFFSQKHKENKKNFSVTLLCRFFWTGRCFCECPVTIMANTFWWRMSGELSLSWSSVYGCAASIVWISRLDFPFLCVSACGNMCMCMLWQW